LAIAILDGFPDATTTGVPAGTTLTNHNGDLIIDTPGAVISGLNITGTVYINAPNVTLENCKVTSGGYLVVDVATGVTGTTVQNCELNGTGSGPQGQTGIGGSGTFIGNNIYGVENGINVEGSNTLIQDNYIHGLSASGDPHYDGVQISGGFDNTTVRHNTIINTQNNTSAVFIVNDFGSLNGVIIDNNELSGGSYTVYSDQKPTNPGKITGVQFTNNKIGEAGYGWASVDNNTVVWSGNTDLDTGKTVSQDNVLSSGPTNPLPTTPTIASFSDDSGIAGDGITNDNTLTLSGKAAANSTVKVMDGTKLVGTATASSGGVWTLTTAALADGGHKFTATATTSAGTSGASSALSVTVDTAAPKAPTIATSTSAATLASTHIATLTGTAEANSSIKVFDGATQVGTATANASGAWSFTTAALAVGSHSFTAKAMDAAGNTGVASAALAVAVTTTSSTPPSAPTIASFSTDSGVVGDGITNDNTLTLTGKAAANSTVKVFDGAKQVGTATAGSDGSWSAITSVLNDAKHALTAKVTDASGQTSAASAALTVTIDTSAPGAPTIAESSSSAAFAKTASLTAGSTNAITLTGAAEANSTIDIFDGGKQIGTSTAGANGVWTYTTGTLASGNHSFTAKAVDVAGNMGAASAALTVNVPTTSAPPAAPNIASFSNDSGVAGDHITNDNTLTLSGTAVANATVTMFDGTKQIGTAIADKGGAWTYTTAALADGSHTLTATDTDASGHASSASSALSVTVDTHAPTAPTLGVFSSDGNAVSGTTPVDDFLLKGTAEANSTVHVFDGGKQIGTATTNGSGAWNFDTGHLADGSHSFTSTASDVAGNASVASASKAVTVDDPPSSIELTGVHEGWHHGVSIKGTADAYSQIKIFDGSTSVGTVTAGSDGTWSFATWSASTDQVHTFSAKELDSSGHVLATSGSAVLGSMGSNTLIGTSGNDLFQGNGHPDTFVFAPNFGNDIIKDFRSTGDNHDVVQFSKSVFDSFADVLAHATQSGHDVVIAAGAGESLTLKNTKLATLDKTDFHFA
jgi:hypothetical protein